MKTFTDQFALTVIAPLDPLTVGDLRLLLTQIRNENIEENSILPFKKLNGVHFCRFLILDGTESIPPQLAYATNFDYSEKSHIEAIKRPGVLSGFHKIFSFCPSYRRDLQPEQAVEDFIMTHKQKVHTFYRGHRGLSVRQIQREYDLYCSIQSFLDNAKMNHSTDIEIKEAINKHIRATQPSLMGSHEIKISRLPILVVALLYLGLPLLLFLGLAFYLGVLIPAIIILLLVLFSLSLYLRYLEKNARELFPDFETIKDSQNNAKELTAYEDRQVQNQLSHLVPLRPGIFRLALQRFALSALNKLAILTYNQGRLGDIATIHFARWSIIDGGKRLLFFSNFDGSWENYLGDFVDRAAVGLTLAWSNTVEFPKTRWLILDGAKNEELFKTWTRKYQIVTQVWYTAYKHLTVKNILRNHKVAVGLEKDLRGQELKDWLKLL